MLSICNKISSKQFLKEVEFNKVLLLYSSFKGDKFDFSKNL